MANQPSFDITLPFGWGQHELEALLAPVEGVHIYVEGMRAQITFQSQAGARAAAELMKALGQQGAPEGGGGAPQREQEVVSSPGLHPTTSMTTFATTLLVSYRHTWRLVESLHGSLLEAGREGPVHKAEAILHKLQVAQLMEQLSTKNNQISSLKCEVEERGEVPVGEDIHAQLDSAASMIQSTQKQLKEARDKSRQTEQLKEKFRRSELEAQQQLQAALSRHAKELSRKTLQTEELELRVTHVDSTRRLEYSELYTRFDFASHEMEEWSALSVEMTQNLTRILAEEMLALSTRLQEDWQIEKDEGDHLVAEEREAQELMMTTEREAAGTRIAELEARVVQLEKGEEEVRAENESLKGRALALQTQLDESTQALANQTGTYNEMSAARQHAEKEREAAVSVAEAAKQAAQCEQEQLIVEQNQLIAELKASLADSERQRASERAEQEAKSAAPTPHDLAELRHQHSIDVVQFNDKYTALSMQYDTCLEEKRHCLTTIETLNAQIVEEGRRALTLEARITELLGERSVHTMSPQTLATPTAQMPCTPVPLDTPLSLNSFEPKSESREMSTCTTGLEADAPSLEELGKLQRELEKSSAETELWRNEARMRGDAASEVLLLEKKVGLYVEREQQLKNALRQSGVEIDQLAASLQTAQSLVMSKASQVQSLEEQVKTATHDLTVCREDLRKQLWHKEEYERIAKDMDVGVAELRCSRNETGHLERSLALRESELHQMESMHAIEIKNLQEALTKSKSQIEKVSQDGKNVRSQMQQAAASLTESVKAHAEESKQRQEGIREQKDEVQRVNELLASSDAQVLHLTNHVNSLTRQLDAERARFEELEQMTIAHSSNFQVLKGQLESTTTEKKVLTDELVGLRRVRGEEVAEAGAAARHAAAERDGLTRQLRTAQSEAASAIRDRATAEDREDSLRCDLQSARDDVEATQERLVRMTCQVEELRTTERKAQHELVEVRGRCTALSEELAMNIPEPVDPLECKKCEVYQSARRLQQEVLSSMQCEVANAAAETEAQRHRANDFEAQIARLQTEVMSLRALLAESEAHVAKLEGRPSKEEYQRVLGRLQASEGTAATMDADVRTAQRDVTRCSTELHDKTAEVASLRRHIEEMEASSRQGEAALQGTVDRLAAQLAEHSEAVYKAEHALWDNDTPFSLYADGSFGRGTSEGYWSVETPKDTTQERFGMHLRLLWSELQRDEHLISDTCGEEWVGESLKLSIIGKTPDWLAAALFRKGVEDAEARAASAQWKLQAAGSPHAQASPQRNFEALSPASPKVFSPAPSPHRAPSVSATYSAPSIRTVSLPTVESVRPPELPIRTEVQEVVQVQPTPGGSGGGGGSGGVLSGDHRRLQALFSAEFPKVDATMISGVAHNVAEGAMQESQARLMLMEMASMDSFDEI